MKRTKPPLKKRKRTVYPSLPTNITKTDQPRAISKDRIRKQHICSMAKTCWYGGSCPHRTIHRYDEKACTVDFCSLMNFKNCKCVVEKT